MVLNPSIFMQTSVLSLLEKNALAIKLTLKQKLLWCLLEYINPETKNFRKNEVWYASILSLLI